MATPADVVVEAVALLNEQSDAAARGRDPGDRMEV